MKGNICNANRSSQVSQPDQLVDLQEKRDCKCKPRGHMYKERNPIAKFSPGNLS
jgi:hypothetical protein